MSSIAPKQPPPHRHRLRAAFARELDPALRDAPGLSITNSLICWLIGAALLMTVLRTEIALHATQPSYFLYLDVVLGGLLSIEYLLRAWASIENPAYPNRLAYLVTPAALLDLLAVLVTLLSPLGTEGFLLRLAMLLRILRIAKLGRFSLALSAIVEAVQRRAFELWLSLGVSAGLLLITSSLLYLVEGGAQPEAFGSIPRAMWWSVATLTTVGYGDVYPITPLGRFFAAITAIAGIGLIAMPTGILASAFSDVFQARQSRPQDKTPPPRSGDHEP